MQSHKTATTILALLTVIFYYLFSIRRQKLYIIFIYAKSYEGFTDIPINHLGLLYPFIINGAFLFILYRFFLSQFGVPVLSLKNILFAILLPLFYLISSEIINLLLSLLAFYFIQDSFTQIGLLSQAIYTFQAYFGSLLAIIFFLILVNLVVPYFLNTKSAHYINKADNHGNGHRPSKILMTSLLLALMIIITGHLSPYLLIPFVLLPSYEEAPYFSTLFSILYTMIFIGYFTAWSKNRLLKSPPLSLDAVIDISFKICFLLSILWFLWDYLAEIINTFGDRNFIPDLNKVRPIRELSYSTSAGISTILLILAIIFIVLIAQRLVTKRQQILHYGAMLLLFMIILYDAIAWGLSLRLILFQSGLFLFSTSLIILILSFIYPIIWQVSTRKLSKKCSSFPNINE